MREGIETTQTFIFPNAIVNVHFSELTKEQRNLRMKVVKKATEEILKAKERTQHERKN